MKDRLAEDRISMRTNIETKKFLAAAATMSGFNSLSSFILSTAYREAKKILSESQGRIVSESDMEVIRSLLNNPPEPNDKLVAAMSEAASRYEDTPDSEFYL